MDCGLGQASPLAVGKCSVLIWLSLTSHAPWGEVSPLDWGVDCSLFLSWILSDQLHRPLLRPFYRGHFPACRECQPAPWPWSSVSPPQMGLLILTLMGCFPDFAWTNSWFGERSAPYRIGKLKIPQKYIKNIISASLPSLVYSCRILLVGPFSYSVGGQAFRNSW